MDAISDVPGDTWMLRERPIFVGRLQFIAILEINAGRHVDSSKREMEIG